MTNAIDNLPPEMKARLAQIMAQAQGNPPESLTRLLSLSLKFHLNLHLQSSHHL